jgi:aldose 1-epimerase
MKKNPFGTLPDGRPVNAYTLKNRIGAEAMVINYGAAVTSLTAPDRAGRFQDVVLGFDRLEDYVERNPYFGVIVGRYGNRIGKGRFTLDGEDFTLAANSAGQHLHGGVAGFDKRLWAIEETASDSGEAVVARLTSADGDEGYPGEVTLEVRIVLSDENELRFEYEGVTDRPTLLNPTHHGYFNLSGSAERPILDHELMIAADRFTPVNADLIPTGEIRPVDGTPLDFRQAKPIGQDIEAADEQIRFGGGFDHNWVLNGYEAGKVRCAAKVYEATSGRVMEMFTCQPGVQCYTGNFLDGTLTGKGGAVYHKRTGLCLEAQHYPDSPNRPHFPSTVLRPGEVYRQVTAYRFSVVP